MKSSAYYNSINYAEKPTLLPYPNNLFNKSDETRIAMEHERSYTYTCYAERKDIVGDAQSRG